MVWRLHSETFCYAFSVQNFRRFVAVVILALLMSLGWSSRAFGQSTVPQSTPPSGQPSAQQQPSPTQSPATGQQAPTPAPAPPAAPVHVGPTVILDPAHGGTDSGARGEGVIEKDIVLQYARIVRGDLERQGFRVVLTRDGDSNPSYDDRAAVANAYRDAVFISLHVSSTGNPGTAHVYFYRFGSAPTPPGTLDAAAVKRATSLVGWEEAQLPHIAASHRLADTIQKELAQRFGGSPMAANAVAVRGLRSVDAPALAIEISSVSEADPDSLAGLAGPLALSISRGLQAFRAADTSGSK
jgi:N-acetylmuramoyl-L-alanine amidase